VCVGHSGMPHNITQNHWGIFNPSQAFQPVNGFYWSPVWTPSKSNISENHIEAFTLAQNYPNPFNPETSINYSLEFDSIVELSVFNSNGQLVKELLNQNQLTGSYNVNFDGSSLNSGIYFYRLTVNGESMTNKMILTK
jgi:hypothetical protein